jgi:hypothetical protein
MTAGRCNLGVKGSIISPANFFSREEEKTKLNWYCFEYARELERSIRQDRRLCRQLHRKKVDDRAIAGFCIHYAKQMQREIIDRVSGHTKNVRLGYEEIETYFPDIGDLLVDRLLTAAARAWDWLTEVCVVCPTRCISERNEIASMFDDPYYWG